MKIKNLIACLAIFLAFAVTMNAQDKVPEEQLGFGIELGNTNWIGVHGVYAINADMHLGAHAGFVFDGGTKTIESTSNLLFAPFFRYFLPKIAKSLKPFAEASFILNTGSRETVNINDPNNKTAQSFTETSINISGGAHWFPYSSVGVYGGFRFFSINFDQNSRIKVGIGQPFVGIEWFLDK